MARLGLIATDETMTTALTALLVQHGHDVVRLDAALSSGPAIDLLLHGNKIAPDKLNAFANVPRIELQHCARAGQGHVRCGLLLDRIRDQQRLQPHRGAVTETHGLYTLDRKQRTLTDRDGCNVTLTDREAAMIAVLWQAAPAPVSRETLLTDVWGYHADADTHTIETHVYNLRRKFTEAGLSGDLIGSAEGGYAWAA